MKAIQSVLIAILFLLIALAGVSPAQEAAGVPVAFFPETTYTFDPVVSGTTVSHTYKVTNQGSAMLEIQKVGTG